MSKSMEGSRAARPRQPGRAPKLGSKTPVQLVFTKTRTGVFSRSNLIIKNDRYLIMNPANSLPRVYWDRNYQKRLSIPLAMDRRVVIM